VVVTAKDALNIIEAYRELNAADIKTLEIIDHTSSYLPITDRQREDWKFMGLGAVGFIENAIAGTLPRFEVEDL